MAGLRAWRASGVRAHLLIQRTPAAAPHRAVFALARRATNLAVYIVAVQVHQYQVGMSSQMVVPMTFQADSGLDD